MAFEDTRTALVDQLEADGYVVTLDNERPDLVRVRHPEDYASQLKETITLYQEDERTMLRWSFGETLPVLDVEMVARMIGRVVTPTRCPA